MSWFDIIVLIILIVAFIRGLQKGLTMQLAGLVSIIVGAIFAGKAADIILPFIIDITNIEHNIALVLSYVLAFIIIALGINLIGKMLHTLFEALHIGFLNKILGSILGVLSASFVLSIFINLAVMLDSNEEIITSSIKTETYFYKKIQQVAPIVVPYLKEEVWEKHIQDRIKKNDDENEDYEQDELAADSTMKHQKL